MRAGVQTAKVRHDGRTIRDLVTREVYDSLDEFQVKVLQSRHTINMYNFDHPNVLLRGQCIESHSRLVPIQVVSQSADVGDPLSGSTPSTVTSNIDIEAGASDDATNLVLEISVVAGDTVVSSKEMDIRNVFGNPSPGPCECEGGHASTLLSVSNDDVKSTDAGKVHGGSIAATGGSILPSKRGLASAGARGRRCGKQEENKPPVSRANGFSPVSDESDSDGTRSKRRVRSSSTSGGEGFSPLSDDEITSGGGDAEVATDEPDGARIAAPRGKVPSRLGSSAIYSPPGAGSLVATIAATCATAVDATSTDTNSDHLIVDDRCTPCSSIYVAPTIRVNGRP
jgi:hypothetical protein